MEDFEKIIDDMVNEIYQEFKGSGGKEFHITDMIELVQRDIEIGNTFNERFNNIADGYKEYIYLDSTELQIMREEKYKKLIVLCHNKQ